MRASGFSPENDEYHVTDGGSYPDSNLIAFTNEKADGSALVKKANGQPLARASFRVTHPETGESDTATLFIDLPKDANDKIGPASHQALLNLGIPQEELENPEGWDPDELLPMLQGNTYLVTIREYNKKDGARGSSVESAVVEA